MDIIKMTRELGKAIQADPRYSEYTAAKEKNDGDSALQDLIGEFNLKRIELNTELSKTEREQEKLQGLDSEIKSLYGNIMANENMAAYNESKNALDSLLSQINMIITSSANGEDPETCPTEQPASGCGGGGCSSCSGCG
ncbi:MAG: YlbF family regulator [Oscillospiraceae bacterium]|nr:YlbF family regulator [Oscillospiraceae bacterium]